MVRASATADLGAGAYIRRCLSGEDLTVDETRDVFGAIVDGSTSQAQVSALLVALCAKGEGVDEIVGAAQALRARMIPVQAAQRPLMDVCGTGGDALGTFNISTAVAFVVAGAGVAVAKHGNRAMSSRCGSADVIEALGVRLETDPGVSARLLERHGIAFLHAQAHHPAMRSVATVRREIGVRTLFNLIGPLSNPAGVTHQVVGVASARAVPLVARALAALGSRRGAVVRGEDGLDEVSLSCATRVVEWTGERIIEYVLEPETFGLQRRATAVLAGGDAHVNAGCIRAVLDGQSGPHRDVVLLNAALALYIAAATADLASGFSLASSSIDSGAARHKLAALVEAGA
jgi:anthranilate phosphoribosyltransferase